MKKYVSCWCQLLWLIDLFCGYNCVTETVICSHGSFSHIFLSFQVLFSLNRSSRCTFEWWSSHMWHKHFHINNSMRLLWWTQWKSITAKIDVDLPLIFFFYYHIKYFYLAIILIITSTSPSTFLATYPVQGCGRTGADLSWQLCVSGGMQEDKNCLQLILHMILRKIIFKNCDFTDGLHSCTKT